MKQAIDQENHPLLKEAINEEALQVESSNLATVANNNALTAEPPDRALSGFAPEKCHDTNNRGVNDEDSIYKEEEREPEKCPFPEENEAENKERKEGNSNDHGSEWSEIENFQRNDNMKVNEEEQGIIDKYENNWSGPENEKGNARRVEANEEQGIFTKYEDERSENEQDDGGYNGYGNVEGDTLGLKDGKYRRYHYPLRPDAEDCSYYMKTGTCKFGSNCKFNHPLRRRNQAAKEPLNQKEENSNRLGQTECKYYSTSGGCKYGTACRYNHGRGKIVVAPILEFNFLGLPIRQGEKECPYYMRNGSCKYGSNCRFNHPDPTAVGGGDPLSGYGDSSVQGGLKDTISGWSSARSLNETAPFVSLMYPPTPGAPPKSEWNGYQAPVYPTSGRSLPTPPAFSMNFPASDAKFYSQHQRQMLVEEYPERPGQPECSYFMKTGDCKFRSGCKFHHPKNRNPKTSSLAVSDQGLPLRPDQNICTHYSRYGICKFGPACKYDHPVTYDNSASSAGSGPGQPVCGDSATADREWERESLMQQSV